MRDFFQTVLQVSFATRKAEDLDTCFDDVESTADSSGSEDGAQRERNAECLLSERIGSYARPFPD